MAVKVRTTGAELNSISIALGSVAPVVVRAFRTESLLTNAILNATIIEQARSTVSQEITPITDVRSTEHYRRTVTGNAIARVLWRLM
jgi:CO/xanthine dehydrogenase FAD-binding subunit